MTSNGNDKTQKMSYGGPPMVRIDGALARKMREDQGLTQLYIATVVGVTTDTISRWENRKYPSVKKENALKLAEALGVELEALLDKSNTQENEPDGKTEAGEVAKETVSEVNDKAGDAPVVDAGGLIHTSVEKQIFWKRIVVAGMLLVMLAAAGFYWYLKADFGKQIIITADRILPPHVPAGGTFPVIIRLGVSLPDKISLILTEHVPEQVDIIKAVPDWSASTPDRKKIKWIVTSSSGADFTICYMARISSRAKKDSYLMFQGEVTSSLTGRQIFQVNGSTGIRVEPFHWADTNSDGQIDDEEILRVFDELGDRKGLAFGLKEIKEIWSSGGYRWDRKKRKYIAVRQETGNET